MAKSALVVLAATTSTVHASSCQCSCCNWCYMAECEDGYHCCGATGPDGPWVHPACTGTDCLSQPWCSGATCDSPTPPAPTPPAPTPPAPTPPAPTPPHVVTGTFTVGPYQDPSSNLNCDECTETYIEGCMRMIWHDEGGAPGDRVFLTQCEVANPQQLWYPTPPAGTLQEDSQRLPDQFFKNEGAGDSKCLEGWHGEDKATMRPNCHASVDDVKWIIPEGVNVPITAITASGEELCLECGSGYDNPCYSRPCDATIHRQLFTIMQHPGISVDHPMEV